MTTMNLPKQIFLVVAVCLFVIGSGHATATFIQPEISVSRALAGHVVVRGTEEPAGGVTVEICSSDWKTVLASTKTNKDGYFSFQKPPAAKLFYIRLSAPGMDFYELRVRIKKQAAKELTIHLGIAT